MVATHPARKGGGGGGGGEGGGGGGAHRAGRDDQYLGECRVRGKRRMIAKTKRRGREGGGEEGGGWVARQTEAAAAPRENVLVNSRTAGALPYWTGTGSAPPDFFTTTNERADLIS